MAVIISAKNIDRYLTWKENAFDVELRLPEGAIVLQAVPIYFKKLSSEGKVSYLIGSRFTNVHQQQLARLITFLRSLPISKPTKDR
jgi:hypothetical protein